MSSSTIFFMTGTQHSVPGMTIVEAKFDSSIPMSSTDIDPYIERLDRICRGEDGAPNAT